MGPKGFSQTQVVDYNEVYNPVVKASTIKVVLSMIVMHK